MNYNYNIGLDIGTNSVGWAVVQSNTQRVIRKGNKKLWGARLFEEATSASDRREFRCSRRKYDRRRQRIFLLREAFQEEINLVDSDFFYKLDESFYNQKDLNNKKHPLSKKELEELKKYQTQYKTIYHLRNKLINSMEKVDIRLVYLAIHHIIKYRGNFLYNSDNFNVQNLNILEKIFNCFDETINTTIELDIDPYYKDHCDCSKIENILLMSSKNDKKVLLKEILMNNFPKCFIDEFIRMMNGNIFNFGKMISLDEEVKLSFNSTDFDDKYNEYEEKLQGKIGLLTLYKELYDMCFLKKLFKGSSNINLSGLMVEKYNIHQQDLRFLKKVFRRDRKIYNKVFRSKKDICIYEKYISNNPSINISKDEFTKIIQRELEIIFEKDSTYLDEYNSLIKDRMDNGLFMPKITDTENGKYPYQLNKDELVKIIENQGKYYPFLLEKTKDGIYKLVKLLEFKIPYYVGPLTDEKYSKFAWMKRNIENVKITPYNFNEVINLEDTAEKFIKRMISKCTYLLDEPAMPSQSILYSKYKVMNELKQIRINGNKIDNNVQHKIYEELFLKKKNITDLLFKEYLYQNKEFDMYENNITITGYSADNKFSSDMSSFIDFFGEDGIFDGTSYNLEDAENIIEWITIFEDKDILETKLRKNYSNLSENSINQILSKKYKGWSSLSKKLLTGIYYQEKDTGLKKSILDLMESTEENFMQILNNDDYEFQKIIDSCNKIDKTRKISYELVEHLATSPATKKGIYQALKIVNEIVTYMESEPDAIMIEMARENDIKQRKDDRRKYLMNLYKNAKEEIENYNLLVGQLSKCDKIDTEKLFLYFIQEGKCLYSGKPLNIDDLNLYEIDHIVPRTLIKDDSIDNKALVYREMNQIKASSYILPKEFRSNKNKIWWRHLRKNGLISAKKYYNLTRYEYTEEDINGFINRQLVETRQITKHVANILKNYYNNTKIIYLKASLSHNYRQCYEFYKFREVNNYHHAKDAYLAAVLGEYKDKYLKRKITFDMIKNLNQELYKQGKYDKLKYGYVINSLDSDVNNIMSTLNVDETTGEVLFDCDKFRKNIEYAMYANDVLISRKTEFKTGQFYNQSKLKKGNKGVPLKENLPTDLYGSYNSLNSSYALFVQYTKKAKQEKRLIGMPIYYFEKEKTKPGIQIRYIRELLGLRESDEIKIISKPIPFYSLLDWNGQICYLVGATDKVEVTNAKEFYFNKKAMENFKYALNKLFNHSGKNMDIKKYEKDLEEIIKYIVQKIEKEYELYKNLVPTLKEMINYPTFTGIVLEQKELIIVELFKLLKANNSMNANFKFLNNGFSSAFGKKHNRIISNVIISCRSITGIKETTYEF